MAFSTSRAPFRCLFVFVSAICLCNAFNIKQLCPSPAFVLHGSSGYNRNDVAPAAGATQGFKLQADKYMYAFSLCGDVQLSELDDPSAKACAARPPSAAYQITKETRYHPSVCYSLAKSDAGISAAALPPSLKIDSGFLPTDDVVRLSFGGGGQNCLRKLESTNSSGHKVVEWIEMQRQFEVDLLCDPAFPPLIPLSTAASAISHGLVVAMEMRQCEYRAVIPSSLACGSNSSFLRSVFGFIIWSVTTVLFITVYLLVFSAAVFVVSAFTGYGSRFAPNLPEPLLAVYLKLSRKKFVGSRKQGDGI